jgi:protein phosphatase
MEMPPNLSLSPDAGFEKDPAVSTLSPEDGFVLPALSPEIGLALSTLSPEDGFGLSSLSPESEFSAVSTLSPEEGFILPALSPEEGFEQSKIIPDLAELVEGASENKIDRKAVAQQIKAEKETYKAAIFQFVQGKMTQESISANLDRLVGAFESGNLYDKWRAVDFFDGIRAAIQKRIDGKLAEPSEMENFTRFLDTMGFSAGLVEVMRQETMLTATDKELYVKLAEKIGDDKVKDKCLEIINKDERTPIEWWLLSLLSTRQIGEKAHTSEEAAKMADDMNLPAEIEMSNPFMVLNNATVEKVWQMLKKENPALYEKLITLLAKPKDEELTPDDKEVVRGVLSGKLGEKAIDSVFGALIQPQHMKFYIEEKYLSGAGLKVEDADKDVIIRLAARHFAALPLPAAERQTLRFLERKYDNLGQNLKIDFIHGKNVDFEKMDNGQKINYLLSSIEAVTQSVDMHPTDESVQTLADLTVMAERIALLLSLNEDGKTTDPEKYADLIKKISLPKFITQRQAILFETSPALRDNLERLRQLYLDEKKAFDQQVEDDLKTKTLSTILNEQLHLMADELPDLQEEVVEQKAAEIEVQSSTLAKEDPENPNRKNEDVMFQTPDKKSAGVFDGMGGHASGEVASRVSRDYIGAAMESFPPGLTLPETEASVHNILNGANQKVYQESLTNPEFARMGTTTSIVRIWESPTGERKAVIGNVGDSRVYLFRNGKLEQITLDDNDIRRFWQNENDARAVQAKLSNIINVSELTDDKEKLVFNTRNVIGQCLGNTDEKGNFQPIAPRIHTVALQAGDRLIIMSDGISDNLTDNEISNILAQNPNNAEAVKKLTEAAQLRSHDESHKRHKADDITGMIIAIPAETVVKAVTIKEMKTEDIIKEANELAAKMTDEASYAANIKRYLDLTSEYEGRVPEGTELGVENPVFAESSPEATERFHADEDKFLQEQAAQTVQEIQAAPTPVRVEETRGLAKFTLEAKEFVHKHHIIPPVIAVAIVASLIGIGILQSERGAQERRAAVPMPQPGAPTYIGPIDQRGFGWGQQVPVPPKTAETAAKPVETPFPVRRENPNEFEVIIGGTGDNAFPTAGDATHKIMDMLGKEYEANAQWDPERSRAYWWALEDASGIKRGPANKPWETVNELAYGTSLKVNGPVFDAAQKLSR